MFWWLCMLFRIHNIQSWGISITVEQSPLGNRWLPPSYQHNRVLEYVCNRPMWLGPWGPCIPNYMAPWLGLAQLMRNPNSNTGGSESFWYQGNENLSESLYTIALSSEDETSFLSVLYMQLLTFQCLRYPLLLAYQGNETSSESLYSIALSWSIHLIMVFVRGWNFLFICTLYAVIDISVSKMYIVISIIFIFCQFFFEPRELPHFHWMNNGNTVHTKSLKNR